MRDYYDILEIEKNASKSEIKKAYRKMAIRHHPDKNQDDENSEEKFKEVNEANSVLSDPEKRKLYDRHGHDWENAGRSQFGGFGDPFEEIIRQREYLRKKGKDITIQVSLTLEECYNGCVKEVSFNVNPIVKILHFQPRAGAGNLGPKGCPATKIHRKLRVYVSMYLGTYLCIYVRIYVST